MEISLADVGSIIAVVSSLIALFISIRTLSGSYSSLHINGTLKLIHAELGHIDESGNFACLFDQQGSDSFFLVSFRIVNPKPHKVSIFNINVTDESDRMLRFLTRKIFPLDVRGTDFLLPLDPVGLAVGVHMPFGDSFELQPGGFAHLDFLIPFDAIFNDTRKIKVRFRDSIYTLFPRRMNITGSQIMHHKAHTFSFKITDAQVMKAE